MPDIIMDCSPCNLERLDLDLRTALGDSLQGLSYLRGRVLAHLTDNVDESGLKVARSIIARHDPSLLSPAQEKQAALAQSLTYWRGIAKQQLLEETEGMADINLQIIRKIRWLETEITHLKQLLNEGDDHDQ